VAERLMAEFEGRVSELRRRRRHDRVKKVRCAESSLV
jgi:hypothetical protein